MLMCCQWHHCIPKVKTTERNCNMTWFGHNWHHHKMLMALSKASLHSLCLDDWKQVQHDFFGHVIPCVPSSASYDANDIINGTTAFLTSTWFKWNATWPFWSCDAISTALASDDFNSVINGIITFLRSRWSKWGATYFWSYVAITTDISNATRHWCQHQYWHWHTKSYNTSKLSSTWCHWWHQQYHVTRNMLLPCTR